MANLHGRNGINYSQYINNLNALPTGYEQESLQPDDVSIDRELAMFTNTDFVDFETNNNPPNGVPVNYDVEKYRNMRQSNMDMKYEDMLQGDSIPFLTTYPTDTTIQSPTSYSPTAAGTSPVSSTAISPTTTTTRPSDSKRKLGPNVAVTSQASVEEQTRIAAEEDKRRRNTAASARFRIKKKQREQALERTVKDINDKNSKLEAKVTQLEMENKWLKDLIIQKNGKQTESDISEMYQKFRKESEECDDRKPSEHTEGVGTTDS